MSVDIIFLLILIAAVFKGLKRGLIVAVFSMIGLIAGLAAAVKLSAVVANSLKDTVHVSAKWLPVLAFLFVFILVILLVRWAASLIEAAISLAMLGWINKLAGVLLYMAIYITIFSVVLFYATRAHLITDSTIASSKTYDFIRPWGPELINRMGTLIPFFKDMFAQLESFFDHLQEKWKA